MKTENILNILKYGMLIFGIVLLFVLPSVKAQIGCCEEMIVGHIKGGICQEVLASQCAKGWVPTLCENTFLCKKGCCVDNVQGTCTLNTPRKLCDDGGGTFVDNDECDIDACEKQCCIIGSTPYYITEIGCNQLAKSKGIVPEIIPDLTYQECIDYVNKQVKGCCKISGACVYMTQASCSASGGSFNSGKYCSQVCSQCVRHSSKGCTEFDEDVHWMDSCGNPEEVYMDCNKNKNQQCEMKDRVAQCSGQECSDKFGTHLNGESWCGYYDWNDPSENVTPNEIYGRDAIGWNSWMHYCDNGKIKTIPCKSGGKEICIEPEAGSAVCMANFPEQCLLLSEVECKKNWMCYWVDELDEYNKIAKWARDWHNKLLPAGFEDKDSKLKACENDFWDYVGSNLFAGAGYIRLLNCLKGSSKEEITATPTKCLPKYPSASNESCGLGSYYGVVHESKWGWIPGAGWACKENCEIGGADPMGNPSVEAVDREKAWSVAMAKRCKSLGKCGAYNNIANVRTTDGVSLIRWGDWEKVLWWKGKVIPEQLPDPELKAETYEKINIGSGFPWCPFGTCNDRYIYYDFNCLEWQAPPGGKDCHVCNEDPLKPCNDDRCLSLGQACVFNSNTGRCVWENQNDTTAPRYISCKKKIENNEYGCKSASPCVKAWMPISFNLTTDERAQCILDLDNQSLDFDNPMAYFGDNGYWQEHMFETKFTPTQNGSHTIYYKCRDRNDNRANTDTVLFEVCTEPDTTAPEIVATSPATGSSIGRVEQLTLYVYTNEPATCRWAKQDVIYEQMSNEFNVSEITGINFFGRTTLTGLQPEVTNFFYLRCKDMSPQNNTMPQSYVLELFPAPPLLVTSIEPADGAVVSGCGFTPRVDLKVTTAEGTNNGVATCYWKKPTETIWTVFSETGDTSHETKAGVSMGMNTIEISCKDVANIVQNSTTFEVKVDNVVPLVTRLYKDSGSLVLRTDERATCTYHYAFGNKIDNCNFMANNTLNAKKFEPTGDSEHRTIWDGAPWFVKCYDECMNGVSEPCTIIWPSDVE